MFECSLTWWGHATTVIQLDGMRFFTDPLLRRRVGPLHQTGHRPAAGEAVADVVLLSHLHHDHTDLPSLGQFSPTTRFVVPAGAAAFVGRHVRGDVEELAVGEWSQVGPVRVHATYAEHDGRRWFGGPTAAAVGFLLAGSASVYFAGDTDLFHDMRALPGQVPGSRLDVALLPVGGWGPTLGPGHLDPARAALALRLLRPRVVIPVHWGTLRVPVLWRAHPAQYVHPATRFAAHAAREAPDTSVAVLDPGESYAVPARRVP